MITRKIKRIFKKNLTQKIIFESAWDRYRVICYWKDKEVGDFVIEGFTIDILLGTR